MTEERLQKVLAAAGIASRRACEEIITAGRVKVNGQLVTELGTKVDPERAQITVDGKAISLPSRHVYVKLHKPRGVLSDEGGDEEVMGGRESVLDLLPDDMRRVFPVGRLDLHSEGLILLTDDGDLAHKLTHPRFHHSKTYFVLVAEKPNEEALRTLRNGVDLPEGRSAPALVRILDKLPSELKLSIGPSEGVWLEMTLYEGKKRQIRHMTAAVGHPTLRLVRWAIGPLTLDSLKVREYIPLTAREVTALRNLVAGQGVITSERKQPRPQNRDRAPRPKAKPPGWAQPKQARDRKRKPTS